MKNLSCKNLLLGVAGATLLSLGLTAPAAATMHAELASNLIDFRVDVPYRSVTLRVSGQGVDVQRTFSDQEALSFAPSEHGLADGTYAWELVANPIAGEREDGAGAAEAESTFGYFTVAGGVLVDPELSEVAEAPRAAASEAGIQGVAASAQVFTTDLIVDGSACVGVDCASNENFGFDTIRLKENNLRIKFDDTSSSGSFPDNDWQLAANDTNNGGVNRFSIEDVTNSKTPFTVLAGAPNNALFVEDSGDIGIGTNAPAVEMHIVDGDSPTLRLQQDQSAGFQAQTWDIVGNEANFFVRDVTNGSKLPFRIKPGAPDDSIFVTDSGDVGLGTDTPGGALQVQRATGAFENILTLQNNSGVGFVLTNTSGESVNSVYTSINNLASLYTVNFADGDGAELSIDADGNVTITGTLTTTGTTCGGGCDLVFAEGYELPTIEEHAAAMWSNGYLPNVGPTIENEPINLSEKTGRILNELEHAHIYISQLNTQVHDLSAEVELKDAQLRAVLERLERLEHRVGGE
ncbi:MAG: hypothetical protein DWQ36_18745 [Acidobacteria bacterium]|nr:MAG: hypothetical protein DWQ30_03695 [Acidobacteriota bacterium]REK03812.1 MAG: hypothetical protein DWQ36_18745 [Acidobacteriota bacterium]